MATDLDIEMDIDMGLNEEGFGIPDIDIAVDSEAPAPNPILTVPNDSSDSNTLEPALEKVHVRGLDKFTTKDIKAFATEHCPENPPLHIEWIDDTSANLVFDSAHIAKIVLRTLAAEEIGDTTHIPVLQTLPAKGFSLRPQSKLEVRFAVVGDRKQAGARERSRFYLFNPEYDPAERRNRGRQGRENKYRDRDDGGYRSQRYDDREQRSRQVRDRESGFDSSLYDDDEAALASRANRRRDSSSSESRGQHGLRRGRRKELFPDQAGDRASGRLRDRSASPTREHVATSPRRRRQDTAAAANRLKAQAIKAHLREVRATGPKELFPHHRRSDAFDAADETAELFSNKMRVPLTDGSGDIRSRENLDNEIGFSIRGAAKVSQGFSIKGAATQVKELFPSHFGDNSGKELFSGRLEGRSGRRQKAEDSFY